MPAPGGGGGGTATTLSALDAKPNPVRFGSPTVVSGRLTGGMVSGVQLRIEADDTRPYGDSYKQVDLPTGGPATATSDQSGKYAFTLKPERNSQYRVIAQTSPRLTSAPLLVTVRMHVGFLVGDMTPRAGSRVVFRGTVRPEHDGSIAMIQRRSSTGAFVTVARTTLRDAGTVFSTYRTRLRIRRDGTYRVKVRGDADHVNGFSRLRTIDAR
jgi:hypothetical protein